MTSTRAGWVVALATVLAGCGSATPSTTPDASGGGGASAGASGGGGGGSGGAAGGGGASGSGAGGSAGATAGSGGAPGGGGSTDAGASDAPPTPSDAPAEAAACTDAGASTLVAGQTYGEYVLESVSIMGAPCGAYTFTVPSPTGDDVELRRTGSTAVIAHAMYDWRMTISATDSTMYATIHFAGYFDLVVRKAGTGTENLYDLMLAIFDGTKVLVVP
jgi:hypothetical protein